MHKFLFLLAFTPMLIWGQACPAVFPTSVHLTLPRSLPPGSYPYVRDSVALWISCDRASSNGVMVHISVPVGSPLTLGGLLPLSDLETLVYSSKSASDVTRVDLGAISTAVGPPERTQQYALKIVVNGDESSAVTIPVDVTFTDSPFARSSDAGLGFELFYPSDDLQADSQALDPAIWFPNSEIPLSFTATSDSWLSPTPASGIGWTAPVVRVQSSLEPGNYFGFVTITAPAAVNSPLKIPAHLAMIAPKPTVAPSSLVFSNATGAPAPPPQQLTISGIAGSSVVASPDAPWLSVDPASTAMPGTVSVSVNGSGLSPGTYRGNVVLRAQYALPLSVPVTFVYGSSNSLHVSPDSFTIYHWPNMTPQDLVDRGSINITGDRAMLWSATTAADSWFSLWNSSGTTPSVLTFLISRWPAPGTYPGAITISSPDASNSPQIVNLRAVVLDAAPLATSPASVEFTAFGADPMPQSILVTAPVPTPFTITTTTNVGGSWLNVSPTSGQTPATITVSIKTAGLGCCSYNGRIVFSIPQPGAAPAVMQELVYLNYYPPSP